MPGLLAVTLLVSACASRPEIGVLQPVAAAPRTGDSVAVLVATTRNLADLDGPIDPGGRGVKLNYQRFTVSIPPNHVAGEIEWPARLPADPETEFAVTASHLLTREAFDKAIASRTAAAVKRARDVVVFVHGYNTSYQEAVFEMAQLARDGRLRGTAVLFSWPSAARLENIDADRESMKNSREHLEETLDDIASLPAVDAIHVVAHSMGGWLVAETLRQAKLRGRAGFFSKLGEVVLISPDIEPELLRTQLAGIGRLKRPMTLVVSEDDVVLAAVQQLSGGSERVGTLGVADPRMRAMIEDYGLRIIDLTDVSSDDPLNHNKFLEVLPELSAMVQDEAPE